MKKTKALGLSQRTQYTSCPTSALPPPFSVFTRRGRVTRFLLARRIGQSGRATWSLKTVMRKLPQCLANHRQDGGDLICMASVPMHLFGFADEKRKNTQQPAAHVKEITTAEDGCTLDSKWHPAFCVRLFTQTPIDLLLMTHQRFEGLSHLIGVKNSFTTPCDSVTLVKYISHS